MDSKVKRLGGTCTVVGTTFGTSFITVWTSPLQSTVQEPSSSEFKADNRSFCSTRTT